MKEELKVNLFVYVLIPVVLSSVIWFPLVIKYWIWTEMKNEYHIQEGYWEFIGRNWYKRPSSISWDYQKEYEERQEKAAE